MVSGMIIGLAVGIAGIIAVGWLAKQTEAGAGITELGKGISSFLSPQITPTFKPMVEIGIGPNIGGFIQWLQDSWGAVSGGAVTGIPKVETPLGDIPVVPKFPSWPPGVVWPMTKTASPSRMYGIDGSRL